MRIAIAQIDPVVGDFQGNFDKISEMYERACQVQARFLLTPELGTCGYPPHDLVERPEFLQQSRSTLDRLMALTEGRACALIVGHVTANPEASGRALQNSVSVLEGGRETFRQAKTLLPTYDVFDEARYFAPASEVKLWNCDGLPVALAICEDLWAQDPAHGRSLYRADPMEAYCAQGAKLLVSLSASPFQTGKRARREAVHAQCAQRLGAPLVYVNQVGANDEILFDGASFAVDSQGQIAGRLPAFRQAFALLEQSPEGGLQFLEPLQEGREDQAPSEIEVLHRALVVGIRDYFARTGFSRAILGLSGGIDSAVVAALAVQALGKEHVLGVAMPSQYSSSHSLEDAEQLARNLGIPFEVKSIKFLVSQAQRELSEGRGTLAPIAQENLQSRLRGLILMTLSNHHSALVLTTGNKSEIGMGYCTLYGDMCGALAPIGDLWKTQVYELAQQINLSCGGVIPERSISKPPSAELRPDQKDQDTLPPYDLLDALLRAYLEEGLEISALESRWDSAPGQAPGWVRKTLRLLESSEYKRRQAAPALRVSAKAFGIGRRMPVAKRWVF